MEQKLVPGSPVVFTRPHMFAGHTGVIKGYSGSCCRVRVDGIGKEVYSSILFVELSYTLSQQVSRETRPWSSGPWQPTETGIVQAEANLLYKLIRGELT